VTEKNNDSNVLHDVQHYRKLVLIYESLDSQIDELIMAHGGGTEKMPEETLTRYRILAYKRDEVQNEMRQLEQHLLTDDDV
jgi:hypothetical protein